MSLYILQNKCDVYNYADNNSLCYVPVHYELPVIKDKLAFASEQAIKWLKNNYMKADPSKFLAICFSREDVSIDFEIAGNVIHSESTVKLLIGNIDSKFNFNQHVTILCKKAARQINALQRLCKYLNYECRLKIYESFITSNFSYCTLVYNTFTMGQEKKMEKLNERALKLVCNDYEKPYSELLNVTGKDMLAVSRKICLPELVYK